MSDEPARLDFTYTYHVAKHMSNKDALGLLNIEISLRRKQLLEVIEDPLGYGWEGRIAVGEDAERQRDFYEGLVAFYLIRKQPVPAEARVAFLMTHGFYTEAELSMVPDFSKNYFEKLASKETTKFLEEEFQKEVLEAVSSALEEPEGFFKGDKEASDFLKNLQKKWDEQQNVLNLQEKTQLLCEMLAFLQDKL